jgi:bacillolysin
MTRLARRLAEHRNLLLLSAFIWALAEPTGAQPTPTTPAKTALDRLELLIGGPVEATISPTTGLATFLSLPQGRPAPSGLAPDSPAEDRASSFVQAFGEAFGIADPGQLQLTRVSSADALGMEHVRFQQVHGGVPITAGEIAIHLKGASVIAVNAKTLGDFPMVKSVPVVTPPEAREIVAGLVAQLAPGIVTRLDEPALQLFNRGLLEGRPAPTRLAWFVEARGQGLDEFIWVDSETGQVLLHFSQIAHAKDREIHDAAGSSSLPGALARSEGQAATGDSDVDRAYDYTGDAYDYFWSVLGRDSYDGVGGTIVSTVDHDAGGCPNASWDGTQLIFCSGLSQADDVVAHEFAHGVTDFTADLYYYMQSGALNESYSDIFGETIDQLNGAGSDDPILDVWFIGEDEPNLGIARDMWFPTDYGDPGKMSDAEFQCLDSMFSDVGGVHSNSGVPNRSYVLMVDGGTYNGVTVTGIGLTKAAKIQYRALEHYLLSASDFLDNYHALNQACQDLIGTSGISAADCTEVGKSLDAVEMDEPWPCSPPPVAEPLLCPLGQAPNLVASTDWESSSLGLSTCPSSGVPVPWCYQGPTSSGGSHAYSGVFSASGPDGPSTTGGFFSLIIGVPGVLPAAAKLHINHSYGFANSGSTYYGGGLFAYSTNGGASYVDAGSLISAGATYGGTVSSCCLNPYGGAGALVDESWGYTATQLDLSTLAGTSSLILRFDIGSSSSTFPTLDLGRIDRGWFIDDIRVYTCSACETDRTLTSAHSGTAALFQASNSVTAGSGFVVGLAEEVTLEAGNFVALDNDFSVDGGELIIMTTPGLCD